VPSLNLTFDANWEGSARNLAAYANPRHCASRTNGIGRCFHASFTDVRARAGARVRYTRFICIIYNVTRIYIYIYIYIYISHPVDSLGGTGRGSRVSVRIRSENSRTQLAILLPFIDATCGESDPFPTRRSGD